MRHLFAVLLVLGTVYGLTVEEQFCGPNANRSSCPVQDYDFLTQQTIGLAIPNSPVSSALYGEYAAAIGMGDVPKNNFIFFSGNNAVIVCSTSKALLFEVGATDMFALAEVALTQYAPTACLANFSMAISTVDLQKTLQFVLAVHDDIKTVTNSLGIQISVSVVPGSHPIHVWTSVNTANTATSVDINLNIKINAFPMINTTCLSTAAAANDELTFQLIRKNDVIVRACKFVADGVIVDPVAGTVAMTFTLTQSQYWSCSNSVGFANSILTFLIKVQPNFLGCTYYEHPYYADYLFNVFVEYVFVQGPFGMIIERERTVADF